MDIGQEIIREMVLDPLLWSYLVAVYLLGYSQPRGRLLLAGLTLLVLPGYVIMGLAVLDRSLVFTAMEFQPFIRILASILIAVAIFHRVGMNAAVEKMKKDLSHIGFEDNPGPALQAAEQRSGKRGWGEPETSPGAELSSDAFTDKTVREMLAGLDRPGRVVHLDEPDLADTAGDETRASWQSLRQQQAKPDRPSDAESRRHSVFDDRLAQAREKAAREKAAWEKRRKGGRFDV